jgi:protein-disulfide isomerase
LLRFAHWLDTIDLDDTKRCGALQVREQALLFAPQYTIAPTPFVTAGNGPVRITVYVSADCSLCKRLVGEMYGEVTTGTLQGKATLEPKPFKAGPGEIGLWIAARESDAKFWQVFNALKNQKSRSTPASAAKLVGISEEELVRIAYLPECKDNLIASELEAKRNDVTVTPTYFINSGKYRSYKDTRWVADAAEFYFDQQQNND